MIFATALDRHLMVGSGSNNLKVAFASGENKGQIPSAHRVI